MTMLVERALHATGLLADFNDAGILTLADVHTARRVGHLGGEPDQAVQLAVALAVRALRLGSVCIDLTEVSRTTMADEDQTVDVGALPWPEPTTWLAACARSPVIAPGRPLRLARGLLYLDRYWREEDQVRRQLQHRAAAPPPPTDPTRLRADLDRLFGPDRPASNRPASDRPAPNGPASDRPASDRPASDRPASDRPASDRPASDRPASNSPASDRPGAHDQKQRLAAAVSALRWVTVLAGGPGTGKTTTIARLLAVLCAQPGDPPRIALAAPTGKAAARLEEAVRQSGAPIPDLRASTLHRLLGRRPGSHTRFRHDRAHHLPYDVIVVDETSMVSLTLMARLLEAVRPDARLILVGDPDQLASVEAGAVLGDIVAAAGLPEPGLHAALRTVGETATVTNGVVTLDRTWRFAGDIAALATAVRAGDDDTALRLLRAGGEQLEFVETPAETCAGLRTDVRTTSHAVTEAAERGDAEAALRGLDRHRLLCAHRRGPHGVTHWTAETARWLDTPDLTEWSPGRPLLITANDYEAGLYNGDTGVVIRTPEGLRAAFARGGETILIPPSRLSQAQPLYAMTVHRSQGSQFDRISLILPPATSPLLTRELFYTAVTRAQTALRILGTEAAVRTAVTRPIARASGLRNSLADPS